MAKRDDFPPIVPTIPVPHPTIKDKMVNAKVKVASKVAAKPVVAKRAPVKK